MTGSPFECPRCGAISHNPNDVREGYCGRCHWWTGDPLLADYHPENTIAHQALVLRAQLQDLQITLVRELRLDAAVYAIDRYLRWRSLGLPPLDALQQTLYTSWATTRHPPR